MSTNLNTVTRYTSHYLGFYYEQREVIYVLSCLFSLQPSKVGDITLLSSSYQ